MRITDRDRALLGYAAEHRLILAAHARALIGTAAAGTYQRLASLSKEGLLVQRTVFHRQPGCYQITRAGLAAIDSELPPPRLDLRCYQHDVGVAWLWLAAHRGALGELGAVVSERCMRSQDRAAQLRGEAGERPHGVRLGGLGPGGGSRVHYPDLLLLDAGGRRIALELELTSKGRTRRERILAGYGGDPRVDAVLYLCGNGAVERAIHAAAARVGVRPLVHVQRVRWRGSDPLLGAHPTPERRSARAAVATR